MRWRTAVLEPPGGQLIRIVFGDAFYLAHWGLLTPNGSFKPSCRSFKPSCRGLNPSCRRLACSRSLYFACVRVSLHIVGPNHMLGHSVSLDVYCDKCHRRTGIQRGAEKYIERPRFKGAGTSSFSWQTPRSPCGCGQPKSSHQSTHQRAPAGRELSVLGRPTSRGRSASSQLPRRLPETFPPFASCL